MVGGVLATSVVITRTERTGMLLMYSISAAVMDLNTEDIFIHQGRYRSEKYKEAVILLYSNNLAA